jgi:hypothetical protein
MTVRDTSSDHARHDLLLVAALAAGDLEGTDALRAESQLASCSACAELATDLRAIASAMAPASLPSRPRPRAFTLLPSDAARLRRAGWRRLLGRFGSPGLAFTRPLAAGLTTLGVAVLVVAALPAGLSGPTTGALAPAGSAAESAGERDRVQGYVTDNASGGPSAAPLAPSPAEPAPSPAASAAPAATAAPSAALEPQASPDAGQGVTDGFAASPGSKAQTSAGGEDTLDPLTHETRAAENQDLSASPGPSPLVMIGWGLLVIGVALFALSWAGRRLA